MIANRDVAAAWETFTVAEPDGNMDANRGVIGQWEPIQPRSGPGTDRGWRAVV